MLKLLILEIFYEINLLTSSRITLSSLNIVDSNKLLVIKPGLFSASVINY